jgi:hypothetical protein
MKRVETLEAALLWDACRAMRITAVTLVRLTL